MTTDLNCESCGMRIESGHYCQYCTDERGFLQGFDTRFAAMVDWQQRRTPDASREAIEAETRSYMSGMPAWRNHPKLASASPRSPSGRVGGQPADTVKAAPRAVLALTA